MQKLRNSNQGWNYLQTRNHKASWCFPVKPSPINRRQTGLKNFQLLFGLEKGIWESDDWGKMEIQDFFFLFNGIFLKKNIFPF